MFLLSDVLQMYIDTLDGISIATKSIYTWGLWVTFLGSSESYPPTLTSDPNQTSDALQTVASTGLDHFNEK